ncbi:hypothetical protein [Brevifollis gellanilyticus]|uniref:Uncharacterized protein n=1 Tax=Brevifollis gellanilyticus TaxID=748831 RepID=A0A512MHM1_9BACT|nr:hypothetical protein [Brevifollis gellanilyticus]GEP46237.1 hypothetical protein BGE01nite_55280 [Brevifollis gellanilyticus]
MSIADIKTVKPLQLWEEFRSAFCAALDLNSREGLGQMWENIKAKTSFYEGTLMPMITKSLGYGLEFERFRFDYTFVDENGIPLIVVESENAHAKASHEINCLCNLAAPLKVLVLSCDWQRSEKITHLPVWQAIIQKNHAVVSVDCLYGIIVGEWDEPEDALLTYSFMLLDNKGAVIDEHIHSVHHPV